MKCIFALFALSFAYSVLARPTPQASSFQGQNGEDAINQKYVAGYSILLYRFNPSFLPSQQFAGLTPDSPCDAGENACVNQQFAQCVGGKFVLTPCAGGLMYVCMRFPHILIISLSLIRFSCAALPLVNNPGTSIACTTQSDVDARIAAATGASGGGGNGNSNSASGSDSDSSSSASSESSSSSRSSTSAASSQTSTSSSSNSNNNGNNGNNSNNNNDNNDNNNGDLQTSLCLDSSLIQTGFEKDGQQDPAENQVASATSSNNFINFCATVDFPLTNGQQVKGGSCNA